MMLWGDCALNSEFPFVSIPSGYFENTTNVVSTMDIVCPYGGALIPLLKNWGILGEVVHAQ